MTEKKKIFFSSLPAPTKQITTKIVAPVANAIASPLNIHFWHTKVESRYEPFPHIPQTGPEALPKHDSVLFSTSAKSSWVFGSVNWCLKNEFGAPKHIVGARQRVKLLAPRLIRLFLHVPNLARTLYQMLSYPPGQKALSGHGSQDHTDTSASRDPLAFVSFR